MGMLAFMLAGIIKQSTPVRHRYAKFAMIAAAT